MPWRACLPLASGNVAVALTGQASSAALLERLAQASFFVDRRDVAGPVYELHPLFRRFLLRRHERRGDAAAVRDTRLRAGRLLMLAGDIDAGLQLLLDAGAWEEAVPAIREHAPQYLAEGRSLSLWRLIAPLPEPEARGLALWAGLSVVDHDPAHALSQAERARADAAAAGDDHGELAAIALAMAALLALGRLPALDPWIDALDPLASVADRAFSDCDLGPFIVPALVTALVFRRPWHGWTRGLADQGERLLYQSVAPGQRLLLGSLSFFFLWQGEQERLTRILLRIDELCLDADAAPAALMRWWTLGTLIKTLVGHVDSAAADVRRMLAMAEHEPALAAQRVSAELQACFVALGRSDPAQARRHLDHAARLLDPDDAANRTVFEHFHSMVALLEDDRPAALRLARVAVLSGRRSGFVVREHIALIGHALAASCNDAHDEAEQLLANAQSHPFLQVCHWHRWIALAVAAFAALRRGDHPAALERVRVAFAVAREHGFRAGPQLRAASELLPRLAALALRHGVETDFTRDLVARNRLRPPPEADHRWPWPVRIRALGWFDVTVDGAPLPTSRKPSRRLLELLRLLAAHGSAGLALDRIADALWPDAEGDAARNALDNLLHRLRKSLGGDDRVLLRHGALSLNPQCCWIDSEALAQGLVALADRPVDELPAALAALKPLCGGPLMPDDAQALVAQRRAALRRHVREALVDAEGRLERAGLADAARELRRRWADATVG